MRAIVGFTPFGSGFEFFGESCGPLFPSEMTQLGELDGKRERLRLPRLSKNRSTLVAGKLRQRPESFGPRNWIRLGQGSHPTCPRKRNPAVRLGPPTILGKQIARNKHAAASHQGNERWCLEKQKHHGPGQSSRIFRARIAATVCVPLDACSERALAGPP